LASGSILSTLAERGGTFLPHFKPYLSRSNLRGVARKLDVDVNLVEEQPKREWCAREGFPSGVPEKIPEASAKRTGILRPLSAGLIDFQKYVAVATETQPTRNMAEAFKCLSILFLAAPIANCFIGKCILETAILLCLYYGVTLPIYHQIAFLILRLASF
jgi:hypothetical protein